MEKSTNNMDIDKKSIGQRIRGEREKLGMSREEFAEIIELSDYYVGQLERGERQMSLAALVKVSNCLHVSLDYLIFGKSLYDACYARDGRDAYHSSGEAEIIGLLRRCSSKELGLFKKLIKTILPYLCKN